MTSTVQIKMPLTLSSDVLINAGIPVNKCYQCGKCSAGCPVAGDMDYPPSLVLRMLQTEDPKEDDKLLRSLSIWLCVSCEMCLSRCPMEIDIPVLMDYLRNRSLAEKKQDKKAKNIISFHKAFLDSVNTTGRLYEIGLIADYKMRSGALTQDIGVAPKMFMKGKLNPIPELIKGRKTISKIFRKTFNK